MSILVRKLIIKPIRGGEYNSVTITIPALNADVAFHGNEIKEVDNVNLVIENDILTCRARKVGSKMLTATTFLDIYREQSVDEVDRYYFLLVTVTIVRAC